MDDSHDDGQLHSEPVAVTQPVAPAEPFFTLTPNPTDGRVVVEVKSEKLKDKSGEATITVCDATGLAVLTRKASAATTLLDLSGFAGGVYLVTLTTPGGTGSQRLVVRGGRLLLAARRARRIKPVETFFCVCEKTFVSLQRISQQRNRQIAK